MARTSLTISLAIQDQPEVAFLGNTTKPQQPSSLWILCC